MRPQPPSPRTRVILLLSIALLLTLCYLLRPRPIDVLLDSDMLALDQITHCQLRSHGYAPINLSEEETRQLVSLLQNSLVRPCGRAHVIFGYADDQPVTISIIDLYFSQEALSDHDSFHHQGSLSFVLHKRAFWDEDVLYRLMGKKGHTLADFLQTTYNARALAMP